MFGRLCGEIRGIIMAHGRWAGREFVGIVERVVYIVYIEDSRRPLHSQGKHGIWEHVERGAGTIAGVHGSCSEWYGLVGAGESGAISIFLNRERRHGGFP